MVKVIKAGLFDTIQDNGRLGFQEFGVPISGAMDRYSANLGNSILGNETNAAVMECVGFGPKLQFMLNTMICITGADMTAELNSEPVKINSVLVVESGDVLQFGKLNYGCRTYISVLGGFQTEAIMASRSMYNGITTHSRINNGDILPFLKMSTSMLVKPFSSIKINTSHFEANELEVYKGPEFNRLSVKNQNLISEMDFTISKDSNRMAYQFNEKLVNVLNPIITSLVLPGTVQLTPSGQLVALMRDCQTTGGYPRVLQLTEASINKLAQQFFSDKIRFKCIK